jgi:hypothetical protein
MSRLRTRRGALAVAVAVAATAALATPAPAADDAADDASHRDEDRPARAYLVPELAEHPFALADGPRPYRHRLSFSPGFGTLGEERIFTARLGWQPTAWLGTEVALGHNPDESVHALLHTLSGLARYPLPGRFQPYATLGYGMILVYPGESLNADPVTHNVLTAGGGLEVFVREDVALRFELRDVRAFGNDPRSGAVTSRRYGESTVALSFWRTVGD